MPKRSDVIYGRSLIPEHFQFINAFNAEYSLYDSSFHYDFIPNFPMHITYSHILLPLKPHSAYCEGPDRTVKNMEGGDNFTLVSRWSTKLVLIPFTYKGY